jgi:acetyl-CoA synthetase
MSYPYQIKSFEEYQSAYNESINDPEKFWSEVAEHFHCAESGRKPLSGIFLNQILNGLWVAN